MLFVDEATFSIRGALAILHAQSFNHNACDSWDNMAKTPVMLSQIAVFFTKILLL